MLATVAVPRGCRARARGRGADEGEAGEAAEGEDRRGRGAARGGRGRGRGRRRPAVRGLVMRLFRRGERPRRSTCSSRGSATRPGRRAEPPQRRLDGRRRDRTALRCLLQVEVQRPARRGSARATAARAPQARDLHERLGRRSCAARGSSRCDRRTLLVVHDDVDLELGRMQARAGGGLAGHNGLRSIAQTRHARTSSASHRRRPAGTGDPRTSPTTCCRTSSPSAMSMRSLDEPPTRSRCSPARVSRRPNPGTTRSMNVIARGDGSQPGPRRGRTWWEVAAPGGVAGHVA